MTPQQLKNSILQQAIEGKLVEQRPEEGNGRDLLKAIQKEKKQLVQAKKIKKEKPLPEITEDEIPFEIPDNWCWCRLGEILKVLTDGAHKTPKYIPSGVPFLSVKNISSRKLDFSNTKFISEEENFVLNKRCCPQKGDILLSKVGTTGIPVIVDTDRDFNIFVSIALLKFNGDFVYANFLLFLLESPVVQEQCRENTRGVGNKNWVIRDIANTKIPIPPLAEQKRIVARLTEILPQVEIYAQAYQELQELNSKFPAQLKNSLLQQAIEGKLVEQRLEEGNGSDLLKAIQKEKAQLVQDKKIKKEKPLPAIKEEEIPFAIPENWCWCRLGDIMSKIGAGSTPSGGKAIYQQAGIKFLRSQNIYNDGIKMSGIAYISEEINEKKQVSIVKPKDILLNITGGSIGRCALVPDDFDIANINQHILIIRNINQHCRKYIHAMLVSPYIQQMIISVQVGVSREGLSAEKTKNFLVPLPPLAEQKRIVAKLEQLLQLCQQLA